MIMTFEYLDGNKDLLILFDEKENAEYYRQNGIDCTILMVSDLDWNRDLSPWACEPVFKKGEAFAGKADDLIESLLHELDTGDYEHRYAAGYSLAGLFTLYLCTKTDRIDRCASVSGSLWYPGFRDYLKTHPVHSERVYVSLGDKEANTKNPVMSTVLTETQKAVELLGTYTFVYFEMNEGNHFKDAPQRTLKALKYITA